MMKTQMTFGLVAAAAILTATSADGAVVAYTSFEEPTAASGNYFDPLDPATDHALPNGSRIVNYVSIGGEMGFSSYYESTGGVGLSDGDSIGVTDSNVHVPFYTDGVQGFELSDTDGIVSLMFDEVIGADSVSIDLWVAETGWEVQDSIRIWIVTETGDEIDLLATAGQDIDNLDLEKQWTTFTADLSGVQIATLHVSLESNAGAERIFIDNILFTAVPAPGALALLGLAGLTSRRRRRR